MAKDATEKEIKKGFRKTAMQWHPDKLAAKSDAEKAKADEKFKEIGRWAGEYNELVTDTESGEGSQAADGPLV